MYETEDKNIYVRIQHVHDISDARRQGMDCAIAMGFERADATKIAVVISELARNIFTYAGTGSISIITHDDPSSRSYIKIIASDQGPGMDDIEVSMTDGYTTSGGLGLGMSGAQRLMDEFSIDSHPGKGTVITAVKWLR